MFDYTKTIVVGDQEVVLDNNLLQFNEQTLGQFIQKMHGYYSYFGSKLAEAELELNEADRMLEGCYHENFARHKTNGAGSDKLAESLARSDVKHLELKENYIMKKQNVKLLQQYLRSWDKAHDNAQSLGHFLRKEMDKLNADIYGKKQETLDDQIERIRRGD